MSRWRRHVAHGRARMRSMIGAGDALTRCIVDSSRCICIDNRVQLGTTPLINTTSWPSTWPSINLNDLRRYLPHRPSRLCLLPVPHRHMIVPLLQSINQLWYTRHVVQIPCCFHSRIENRTVYRVAAHFVAYRRGRARGAYPLRRDDTRFGEVESREQGMQSGRDVVVLPTAVADIQFEVYDME